MAADAELEAESPVTAWLGRIVALYSRSSTLHWIHKENRYLCFWSDDATEP